VFQKLGSSKNNLTYFDIVADDDKTTASTFKNIEGSYTSVPSLVASAHGVVLEVGPGVGTQLDRFDKSKIDHIYGVELNPAFVSPLLAEVETAKLQGKYTVILGAVEDERLLAEYGLKAGRWTRLCVSGPYARSAILSKRCVGCTNCSSRVAFSFSGSIAAAMIF
jgi:hypothetical protein